MAGLDILCKEDSAWYDGTLRWDGDRIRVHFAGFDDDEDEWFDKDILHDHDKLITRVRRTSDQLQDLHCDQVLEEQKVCGCLDFRDSRKYYDAVVKKVEKHDHGSRNGENECLCKFRLLWKAGPKAGRTTEVGCGDICFLSPKQPEDHPNFKALFRSDDDPEELPTKVKPSTKLKKRKIPSSTSQQKTAMTKSFRSSVTDAKMLKTNSSAHRTKKKIIPSKEDQAACMTNKQPHFESLLQNHMPEEQSPGRRKNMLKPLKILDKELEGDPQGMNINLVVDISRDMVGGEKLDSVTSDLAAEKNSNFQIEEIKGTNGHCKGRKNKTSPEAKSDSALSEEHVPKTSKASMLTIPSKKGHDSLKKEDNWQSRRSRSANKVNFVSRERKHPCRPKTLPPNKNDKVLSCGRKAPGEASIDLNGETTRKEQKLVQTSPVVLQSRMLLIENMETDVSAFDALEILGKLTQGICAVHVMPKREFEPSTIGYAVYKDVESAQTALFLLPPSNPVIVASGKGRPWMVSIANGEQEPRVFGFALHSAMKSDVEGVYGIISDQPASQGLQVLTPKNRVTYRRALRMRQLFEKHKNLRLELCKQIVEDEDNCS